MEKSPAFNSQIRHGIMQGRLTKPVNHVLQFFPKDNWKGELDLAKALGFSSMEGVIDSDPLHHPLCSDPTISYLKDQKSRDDFKTAFLESVCLHYFVESSFWSYKPFYDLFLKLHEAGVKRFVLPLEAASKGDQLTRSQKMNVLKDIAKAAKDSDTVVLLETNDIPEAYSIVSELEISSLGLNFDSGNISHEHGPQKCLEFFETSKSWVKGVHLKDKNQKGQSVPFGEGIVDFKSFLNLLKKIPLSFTLVHESYRGMNDDPTLMAKRNLQFLNGCLI